MKRKSDNYARKKYKLALPETVNHFIGVNGICLLKNYFMFHSAILEELPSIEYVFNDGISEIRVIDEIIKSATEFMLDVNNRSYLLVQLNNDESLLTKESFLEFTKNYFEENHKKTFVMSDNSLPL